MKSSIIFDLSVILVVGKFYLKDITPFLDCYTRGIQHGQKAPNVNIIDFFQH